MRRYRKAVLAVALLALALAALAPLRAAFGHSASHDHAAAGAAADPMDADVELRHAMLTERSGRAMHFPGEVLGDGIAVIGFIYTSCTTTCPITSALMADLQARLGPLAGPGGPVRLVTISVDPVTDTPARLAEYAARFGAAPDWLWLTGDRPAVVDVLTGFGVYTPAFVEHPSVILVGDPSRGSWRGFYGFPPTADLLARVGELIELRKGEGS